MVMDKRKKVTVPGLLAYDGFKALLDDLSEKGLLETTGVVVIFVDENGIKSSHYYGLSLLEAIGALSECLRLTQWRQRE